MKVTGFKNGATRLIRAYTGLSVVILFLYVSLPAFATDWQITGYLPQNVQAGRIGNKVTINGSFSGYREDRKVKIGTGNNVAYDLSSQIIVWTLGQVKVVLPQSLPAGQYWLAIYTPDDQLIVKGPETFEVLKVQEIQGIPYKGGSKTDMENLAELEIRKVMGLPPRICAGKTYPISILVVNNGEGDATFNTCTVGSTSLNCAGAPVYNIKAKETKVIHLNIKPQKAFFSDGKWHGKLFLGKVKGASDVSTIIQAGSSPSAASDCSFTVNTSWTSNPGMAVGALFCDSNMRNHLIKLEIKGSTECNKVKEFIKDIGIKKEATGGGTQGTKDKSGKVRPGTMQMHPAKPSEGPPRIKRPKFRLNTR